MICPSCAYEFDPAEGTDCPRCGEASACSGVSCGECDACSGLVERLGRSVVGRLSGDDTGFGDDSDTYTRDDRTW